MSSTAQDSPTTHSPSTTPMDFKDFEPLKGHCPCTLLTFSLLAPPLITHCCHCTYCQVEIGSAFALNTVIESYNFRITSTSQPLFAHRPSPSAPDGSKHVVAYCPNKECNADVYAFYGGNRATVYVKVGVLEQRGRESCKPDVHIFTKTKVGWVDLGKEEERGVKVFEKFYNHGEVWSQESLGRLGKLRAWVEEQQEKGAEV